MLRLFLAWRLLRMLFPLLLLGFAALALTIAFQDGRRTIEREQSSLAHAARRVKPADTRSMTDTRHGPTQALTAPGH